MPKKQTDIYSHSVLVDNPPKLAGVDFEHDSFTSKSKYQDELVYWQKRILQIQQAYYHQNRRAMIVFQGWDAGGKGGAIRRLTEKLDPRGFQVYPIAAPTEQEQSKHYLYRFYTKLPAAGTMAIFDRSWYGRVLVERVEGFASKEQWQRAYQEINEFERMLSDDGVRIVKLFLHITKDEQLKRFQERLNNPLKQWKLTREDIRNREKWADYELAIDEMFARTSTKQAPWHVIAANKKWYTRVEVLKTIAAALEEGVDIAPPDVDRELILEAQRMLGLDVDHLL